LLNYKSALPGTFKKMKNPFTKTKNYFEDSWRELKKVNWPTRPETIRRTGGVLGLSFFIALLLGFLDYGLLQLIKLVVK
jgi:preprotein translocase subunit SecE